MVRNSIPARETREIIVENVRKDSRTVELSFSSEHPVERGWGKEILSHDKEAVNLTRLNSGAAVLLDHDPTKFVGKVEHARIEGKRGKATIRFGKSALANVVWQDVQDGVRQLVSVGYTIDKTEDLGNGSYRVTKWTPYEISFVSVPADITVGVGRSHPQISNMDNDNDSFSKLCGLRSSDCTAAQENLRRREIEALSKMIGKPEALATGQRAILSGMSIDEYRAELLKNMKPIELTPAEGGSWVHGVGGTRGADFTRHSPFLGLSQQEARQFSFSKAIVELAEKGSLSGLEKEISDGFSRHVGQQPQGFWCPAEVMFARSENYGRRDLTAGTATSGGFLVNTDSAGQSLIELLRNKMVVSQMGARMLGGLTGNVAIPRHTGSGTAYWLSETGEVTESSQTFGQLGLVPHAVSAHTVYSKELLLQSSIDVESFVRDDLTTVIALARDKAYLEGTGTAGQPLGIVNWTGIGSVTFGGAATLAKLLEFEQDVAEANIPMNRMGWVTTAAVRAKWKGIPKVSGQAIFLWGDDSKVIGYPAEITQQVSSNKVIFGDWSQLIIGEWGAIDVVSDIYSKSKTRQVQTTVSQWTDCGLRHATAFSVSTDTGAA